MNWSNFKGVTKKAWTPALDIPMDLFKRKIRGAQAVYVPANYWRVLIRKGNVLDEVLDAFSGGEHAVGICDGVYVYTDAFVNPKRGFNPILLVRK